MIAQSADAAGREAALPFLQQDDQALCLVERVVTQGQDGGRVILGLQQARHELGIVGADRVG